MIEYHKIQTVYNRDPATKFKTLLEGEYARPEFEYLANNPWVFTEKVDGTNIRITVNDGRIVVGGRTDNAQTPTFLLDAIGELLSAESLASVIDSEDFCLYGEGYGAKIQKGGGNYRADQSFVLFDVRVGRWWLQRDDVEDVARKLGIDVVPIIGGGTLDTMVEVAREGFTSQWGDFIAEGIVARPKVELATRSGQRVITKIKHKDFQQAKR